jgi:hypothetical protein
MTNLEGIVSDQEELLKENERLRAELSAARSEIAALKSQNTSLVRQGVMASAPSRITPRGDLIPQRITHKLASIKKDPPPVGASLAEVAAYIGVSEYQIQSIKPYPFTDVLYPLAMLCMFHLTMVRRVFIPGAENICNELLQDFIKKKKEEVGAEEYFRIFRTAVTPAIQRLTMMRILLATFEFGYKKMDNLPSNHKTVACDFLGLPYDIKLTDVQDMLEKEQLKYNMEELILGRVGYLIMWKELAGPDYNYEAPNTDKIEAFVDPNWRAHPDVKKTSVQIVRQKIERDSRGMPKDRTVLEQWGLEDVNKDIMEGAIPGIDNDPNDPSYPKSDKEAGQYDPYDTDDTTD